jgi:hypothetical protein
MRHKEKKKKDKEEINYEGMEEPAEDNNFVFSIKLTDE